jgi:protein-tyrosine phosphatase
LHTHIVPGVDDGAGSIEEAFELIRRINVRSEAGSVVCMTPHYSVSMTGASFRSTNRRASRFIEITGDCPGLSFHLAGELMVHGLSLSFIEECRYPGTGWVLTEFPVSVTWLETRFHLKRMLKRGYRPLLAHPERYSWCRRNIYRLVELSCMGCGVLVSARSFRIGKYARTAKMLLHEGLAHGLASDLHSSGDHILDSSLRELIGFSPTASWDALTMELPGRVLDDLDLPRLPLATTGAAP